MGSYLLVANKTLGGEALASHLRRLVAAEPASRFYVVVPINVPVPVDVGGAMGGIAVIDFESQEYLDRTSRERLATLLTWLGEAGVEATGEVVIGDPLSTMQRVARDHPIDGIIIMTLPARVTRWLRMDLVHRVERHFDVPLTTIDGSRTDDDLGPAPTGTSTQESGPAGSPPTRTRTAMGESVYKIIELVGTSAENWEKAAAAAVTTASKSLRDLRVAEVAQLDLVIDNGVVSAYRAKVKVSFKYDSDAD
jgi:flavin-binding protein dodecin